MVVFQDAAPAKADYRHFRIKSFKGQDDYAAMAEVLQRRFGRLIRYRESLEAETKAAETDSNSEDPSQEARDAAVSDKTLVSESPGDSNAKPKAEANLNLDPKTPGKDKVPSAFERRPDLVLIDGGKGQLSAAAAVLRELALDDIPLASLAKKREELFRPGASKSVRLAHDSQALYLVQRARDEAHRFAVTYNRKLRRKASVRSSLDRIPGVGPKRRRLLLTHFGSVDAVRNASIEEIAALPEYDTAGSGAGQGLSLD